MAIQAKILTSMSALLLVTVTGTGQVQAGDGAFDKIRDRIQYEHTQHHDRARDRDHYRYKHDRRDRPHYRHEHRRHEKYRTYDHYHGRHERRHHGYSHKKHHRHGGYHRDRRVIYRDYRDHDDGERFLFGLLLGGLFGYAIGQSDYDRYDYDD